MTRRVTNFTSGRGGERVMAERVALALRAAGFDSEVISLADPALHPQGKARLWLDEELLPPRFFLRLRRAIRGSDLILNHYLFNFASLAIFLWLGLACRKPQIVAFQNHMDGSGSPMRRFCYWLRRFIALHIVCLVARRLVFVTDAGRWHFRDGCLFRRVFDRKAVVIWNYLEPETRTPEWRPRQKPLRLIFCGALARRKRFDLAIALMESLRGEDVRLTVVGDGEMAHLLAGHEAIEWHSGLAPPEVIPHYDPVHALLLPTESEACPLVVLEAMARGVFVLASDLPCLRELVSEGETGRLFPVGDLARMKEIVADLLRHPQEAERMGRAALSAAVRFTNGESARQYVEACRDALGER